METILTGIKPTGELHIGNYFGAIKPAIDLAEKKDNKLLLFVADYHALNFVKNGSVLNQNTFNLACALLACGADKENIYLYLQSDIKEVFELNWILNNISAKGLMNRAHAYKAIVETNKQNGDDSDFGINMGLFCYPILMSADILIANPKFVPVGLDQKQHLEIAKELARVFNKTYGDTFVVPNELITQSVDVVGLDGRKMSKSYGNTIKLFSDSNTLRKQINKIITNSQPVGERKNTDEHIFQIFSLFADDTQKMEMKKEFENGIGWGDVKKRIFDLAENLISPLRDKYNFYQSHPEEVAKYLKRGSDEVNAIAHKTMQSVREKIGKYSI